MKAIWDGRETEYCFGAKFKGIQHKGERPKKFIIGFDELGNLPWPGTNAAVQEMRAMEYLTYHLFHSLSEDGEIVIRKQP